jgi:hypothetical protein
LILYAEKKRKKIENTLAFHIPLCYNTGIKQKQRKECFMCEKDREEIERTIIDIITPAVTKDYAEEIASAILDEVVEDIECCASENFTDSDVRYAIGRTLAYLG